MINRLVTAAPAHGHVSQAQGRAASLPADFARMLEVVEPDPVQPLNPDPGQGALQGNATRQDREPMVPMPSAPLPVAINAVNADPAASVTLHVEVSGHETIVRPITTAYVLDQLPLTDRDAAPLHSLAETAIPEVRSVPAALLHAQVSTQAGYSPVTVHHNNLHSSDAQLVQPQALPVRIGRAQSIAATGATVPKTQVLTEVPALPESVTSSLFVFPDLPTPGLVQTQQSAVQVATPDGHVSALIPANAQMLELAIHFQAFQTETTTVNTAAAQAQEVDSTDQAALLPLAQTRVVSPPSPRSHHEQLLHGQAVLTAPSLVEVEKPMENLSEAGPTQAPAPVMPVRDLPSDSQSVAPLSTKSDRTVASSDQAVEWVSLPWRLQANAALSYHGDGDLLMASSRAGLQPETIKAAAAAIAMPTPINFSGFEPMFPLVNRYSAFQASLPGKVVSRGVSEIDAATHAEPAFLGHVIPLLMWPQRLLRWRNDSEGATAWVRDYQMDAANTATLVDSLRCLAQQQGVSLRRVMLNGHELWRSVS